MEFSGIQRKTVEFSGIQRKQWNSEKTVEFRENSGIQWNSVEFSVCKGREEGRSGRCSLADVEM